MRLACQQTGCAQRYLTHDALNAIGQATARIDDPQRAITSNRQPGKCCDMGCSAPGQPVMVDLPVSKKR